MAKRNYSDKLILFPGKELNPEKVAELMQSIFSEASEREESDRLYKNNSSS